MLYCRAAPALDSCRLPLSGEYFPLKRMSAPAPFAQEHFGYCLWSALACASAKCILRRMQFHISTPTITIKISAAQEPIQRQPSEFSHHLRRSLRDSEWSKKQNTFFILLFFCYQFSLFDFFFFLLLLLLMQILLCFVIASREYYIHMLIVIQQGKW